MEQICAHLSADRLRLVRISFLPAGFSTELASFGTYNRPGDRFGFGFHFLDFAIERFADEARVCRSRCGIHLSDNRYCRVRGVAVGTCSCFGRSSRACSFRRSLIGCLLAYVGVRISRTHSQPYLQTDPRRIHSGACSGRTSLERGCKTFRGSDWSADSEDSTTACTTIEHVPMVTGNGVQIAPAWISPAQISPAIWRSRNAEKTSQEWYP